jgi:hypothetical protein
MTSLSPEARSDGVRRRRLLPLAGAIAFAALAASLALILAREPRFVTGAADGTYRSDCCGTIVLREGQMIANEVRWARYVVQQDELGPFLLPDRWVGTFDNGIVLDGSRPVEKLRLDTLPNPTRIELPGMRDPSIFVRREPRRPLMPGRR